MARGRSTANNVMAILEALHDAMVDMYGEDVNVAYGWPGLNDWSESVVSIGRWELDQAAATMDTNRTRRQDLTVDLLFCTAIIGGAEAEQLCVRQNLALISQLEEYCRARDTELGGLAEWCAMTRCESDGASLETDQASGRCVYTTATFTVRTRITSNP